jgi:hypothetical protein
MQSKKTEGSSPKNTIEKKKVIKTKKASEPSAKKILKGAMSKFPRRKTVLF